MTFNFGSPTPPIHQDPLDPLLSAGSQPQNFGYTNMATAQQFAASPSPLSSVPIIDPLAIDTLAKDFELEPVQRANLHAFVKVDQVCAILRLRF
jgi:hypothetical protein